MTELYVFEHLLVALCFDDIHDIIACTLQHTNNVLEIGPFFVGTFAVVDFHKDVVEQLVAERIDGEFHIIPGTASSECRSSTISSIAFPTKASIS